MPGFFDILKPDIIKPINAGLLGLEIYHGNPANWSMGAVLSSIGLEPDSAWWETCIFALANIAAFDEMYPYSQEFTANNLFNILRMSVYLLNILAFINHTFDQNEEAGAIPRP